MKKIFTLAIFNMVALLSFADDHRNDGQLSITNYSRQDIRVEVDGRYYNDRNNVFMIPSLSPGFHTIKVYRETLVRAGLFRTQKRNVLVYTNRLHIKPRTEVEVVIGRNFKTQVKESRMHNRDEWNRGRNGGGRDDDRWDRNDRDYSDRDGRGNNRYAPMDNRSFRVSLQSLQRELFESTRYEMAMQLIDRNFFTVDQVLQLVHGFAFENNKLELAKCAYGKTIDRQYYARLYEELDFTNSRRELAQYMNSYK